MLLIVPGLCLILLKSLVSDHQENLSQFGLSDRVSSRLGISGLGLDPLDWIRDPFFASNVHKADQTGPNTKVQPCKQRMDQITRFYIRIYKPSPRAFCKFEFCVIPDRVGAAIPYR